MALPPEPRILSLFQRLTRLLDELDPEHAFIGAMARNAWGRPRTTTDLDLEMSLDEHALRQLETRLAAVGVTREGEVGPDDPTDAVPDNLVYRSADGIRVDVLVTKTEFQRQALRRRIKIEVLGQPAWVITPEDLVVYKLIAGRSRDYDDIEDVLESQTEAGKQVDWEYIRRWAEAWGVYDRFSTLEQRFGPGGAGPRSSPR